MPTDILISTWGDEPWRRLLPDAGPMAISLVFLEHLAWLLAADEGKVVATYLLPAEARRFRGFSLPKRRREWLGGRIAAKDAVRRLGGMEPDLHWRDLLIAADSSGRPGVAWRAGSSRAVPAVSISHSGAFAVALAAGNGSCGVDIQKVTPAVGRVADRFCRSGEQALVAGILAGRHDEERLTLLWAAKEAARKAVPVSPLVGFHHLCLARVDGESQAGLGFEFECRQCFPAGMKLRVAALLRDGYALAATVL